MANPDVPTISTNLDMAFWILQLLSNNPEKYRALFNGGIEVVERIRCEGEPSPYALSYLRTKKEKMGHTPTRL